MEQRELSKILDKCRFGREVKVNPSLGYKEEFIGRLFTSDPEVEFVEVDRINIFSEDRLKEILNGVEEIMARHDYENIAQFRKESDYQKMSDYVKEAGDYMRSLKAQ